MRPARGPACFLRYDRHRTIRAVKRSPEWGMACCMQGDFGLVHSDTASSVRAAAPLQGPAPAARQPLLLTTKVVPPRLTGLINRPRLLDLGLQLPARRLTVIKAAAGFGKTS